ncbi:MAG: glycosyl hydrolase family 18 protein [Patescibacteria group bacterium]|nr:glycosyl hydrolase family 18 protein [Patescibacteria group bacterium]
MKLFNAVKYAFLFILCLALGAALGFFYQKLYIQLNRTPSIISPLVSFLNDFQSKREVLGFWPYWAKLQDNQDYSTVLSTLIYFGLKFDADGNLIKFAKPGQFDPGWYKLTDQKTQTFLSSLKEKGVNLSLAVFNGDNGSIDNLIQNPAGKAQQLLKNLEPIMNKYGFSDLNLDVESTKEASDEARLNFAVFVGSLKTGLSERKQSLTIEASASDLVKHNLIDLKQIAPIADKIVIMAYDYHFPGSKVVGPVSPLNGGGGIYEYDVNQAVTLALNLVPPQKLILGIPLYGYGWETISDSNHAAVIPGSALTVSNATAEKILNDCSNCRFVFDETAQEEFLVYPDQETGSVHEIFFPDEKSAQAKISLSIDKNLSGIALWALGYEGGSILKPVGAYLRSPQ